MSFSDQPSKVEYSKSGLQDVDFIQFRYTDVPGRFLAKYLAVDPKDQFDHFRKGIGVDGSSVRGFSTIDESDLLLVPDFSTFRLAPVSKNHKVATVIADVFEGFGRGPLSKDPRLVSKKTEEHMKQQGMTCYAGPEVECFIFDDLLQSDSPKIISEEQGKYAIRRKGGYDAPPSQDSLLDFRFEVAETLNKYYGIKVTNLNHEVAGSGQIEINFMHSTLTAAADNVQVYKDVVRNIAKQQNKVANFMPKPIFDENDPKNADNGSGMHVSISLWEGQKNTFYDASDSYAEISQTGRYFIGGVLYHADSLAAIVAPTVNSYYRMVPGFEAPVYAAWSRGNRSAILRVPVNEKNSAASKRIEFRAPDPSANPYLAFSAIVAAGLDGIRKKMDPGNPVNLDIFKMTESQRKEHGIKSLPGSLEESLAALRSDSDYLRPHFASELIETHINLKEKEVSAGRSKKSQFEMYYDI